MISVDPSKRPGAAAAPAQAFAALCLIVVCASWSVSGYPEPSRIALFWLGVGCVWLPLAWFSPFWRVRAWSERRQASRR